MSLRNELIVRVVLPLSGMKRMLSSAERTRRHIAKSAIRPAHYRPPRRVLRRARVSMDHRHGWPVYEVSPRDGAPARRVLYLHGGAYVGEIIGFHWSLVEELSGRTPCRVTVPIYPLGSAAGAARVVATATAIARQMIESAAGEVVLMGDSAGGGLALAIAQTLRDDGVGPSNILLISPWLDVAVDRPEQRALAPRDPMLAIAGLQEAGRTYAMEVPGDDPRISPINGDFRGLPPITVFTSTDDLLSPDSHRLQDACAAADVQCRLEEAPGLPHTYPLMPTPEGKAARERIVQLLRDR